MKDVAQKAGKTLSDDAIGKQVDDMFADAGKKSAVSAGAVGSEESCQ